MSRLKPDVRTPAIRPTKLSIIGVIIACVLLSAAIAWIVSPSITDGVIASGADTGSYMLTTRYIVESFQEHGRVSPINDAWYAGFAAFHNTPMLAYPPLVLFYVLSGDINTVSHMAHYLFTIFAALAALLALRKRYSLPAATVGAFLFAASPFIVSQITSGGSYPRSLAASLGAACFYFVDEMAEKGLRPRWVLPTTLMLAGSVIAHPMIGAAFIACWTVFFFARTLAGRTLSLKESLYWFIVPAASLALTAWYLIPFFIEQQGWVATPNEVFEIHSVAFSSSIQLLGLPLLAVALIGFVLKRKDPTVRGMLVAGLIGFILSGGVHAGLYLLIPALKAAYPWTFLLFTSMAIVVVATAGIDTLLKRPGLGRGFAIALCIFAIATTTLGARQISRDMAGALQSPNPDTQTAEYVQGLPGDGRVMTMHHPFGYLVYWVAGTSEKEGVEGLYYSLTPVGRNIAWTYDAIEYGFPEYAVEAFDRWNVRYLVANGNFSGIEYDRFVQLLQREGFGDGVTISPNTVYVNEAPSAYISPLAARTLAIGQHAPTVAFMVPGSVVAGSTNIDDYPAEVLSQFDTLILSGFGFTDREYAETLVEEFASNGGHVVIDLYGMKTSAIEDSANFLGVNGYLGISSEGVAIDAEIASLNNAQLPGYLALPAEPRVETGETLEDWRYVTYPGLDESLANEADGDQFSVLGVKELRGGGKAVFVGGGLFFHAFRTGNPDEVNLIRTIADPTAWSAESPDSGSMNMEDAGEGPTASITDEDTGRSDSIAFGYTSESDTLVLVSKAFSPHWKAYVDGVPSEVHNIDNLLVVSVPAGEHSVEMHYESLPLHWIAWLISLATLALLIITYRRSWYRERDSRREHAELS